jgi:hypothetical protein
VRVLTWKDHGVRRPGRRRPATLREECVPPSAVLLEKRPSADPAPKEEDASPRPRMGDLGEEPRVDEGHGVAVAPPSSLAHAL